MVAEITDIETGARRFLRTGKAGEFAVAELAAACDRLVRMETEQSAPGAVRLGMRFVRRAREQGRNMLPTALRALGWAYVVAGKYEAAAECYLEARRKSRDPLVKGRIDRILVDVYMYQGRTKKALACGKRSMAAFRKRKAEADLAKTEVNYANVLHRLDRHPEAQALYHRAGEFFAKQGNDLAAAFCWYNEANTLVQLFDFPTAERLYSEAREIFARHNHTLRAVGCLYGLAWLHMLEGRFHIALQELAECEGHYLQAGQQREYLLCLLDRAETYLSLNLLPDARDAARRARQRARKLGLQYEGAKASFFLGKSLVALGERSRSRAAFGQAEEIFRKEGNEGFLTAVEVAEALAEQSGTTRMEALAAVRERMSHGRLPLWEALCDLEVLAMEPDDVETRRRLASNRAVGVMPHVRAQYLTLLGDAEARRGQPEGAIAYWRQAADILTAVRAELPPIDIRAAFSERHGSPYEKLIAAEYAENPRQAAAWLERYQTAGIWAVHDTRLDHPARDRAEQSLAELALHVAAAAERAGQNPVRGLMAATRAGSAQRRLEEQIRDSLAAQERKGAAGRKDTVGKSIADASRSACVVQLHMGRTDITTFVHEDGRTHGCRLPDTASAVDLLLQRWRFFVERAPYRKTGDVRADLLDEERLLARLAEVLWRPLEIAAGRPVLLVADGPLANLPWAALTVDGEPLIERHALVMAPSVRHHLRAQSHKSGSLDAHVFVGAGKRSPEAAEYMPLLKANRWLVSLHDPCRREDWPRKSEADVWHFTGHGHFRTDNPFYSYLELADGPLFAADFRLRRNVVNLVVLAACRTGVSSLLPGDESTGLIRSLLEMGARNVVASHWAVADESTAFWINRFYETLAKGKTPAAAAQTAARATKERFPSAYDWAGFSLFGAG